jgi:hypothetical protein|tara:strand:+ start:399 stop:1013 length:615 start_codon:yes stop_codon:yes gene_type:complete
MPPLNYDQLGYSVLSSYNTQLPDSYILKDSLSGIPSVSNLYWSTTGIPGWPYAGISLFKKEYNIDPDIDNTFVIYGKACGNNDNINPQDPKITQIYLSANRVNNSAGKNGIVQGPGYGSVFSDYQEITSTKSSTISGYKLKNDFFSTIKSNVVSIHLPGSALSGSDTTGSVATSGKFVWIVRSVAGWASTYPNTSAIMNIKTAP